LANTTVRTAALERMCQELAGHQPSYFRCSQSSRDADACDNRVRRDASCNWVD